MGVLLDCRRQMNPFQEIKEEFMEEGEFELGFEK